LIFPIVTGSCSSSSMGFCGGFIVYLKIFRLPTQHAGSYLSLQVC
jgi:hypothetical protein